MAYSERQNNLFAAEDWKVAYKVFSNIDFTSYDFNTLRLSMVSYIKQNYPENFNDYIESSEFIAIIELLAFVAQSLAFRMDLNSRENFLETAERRDSVFKLARMLGYSPRRRIPASGLAKIVAISTSEPITDSLGNNLAGKPIFWADANNADAYEQFITVLNSALSTSNRFTSPAKEGTVGGIKTEVYRILKSLNSPLAFGFTSQVAGSSRNFEIVDADFYDNQYFYERHPDPINSFGLIYRNDGKGQNSINSGFFMMFKQGQLKSKDFNFTAPLPNRSQDVGVVGINQTDLWVQEIRTSGSIINKWSRIQNTVGQTINFNAQQQNTRNLYAAETLPNDDVRLKFTDGNFGKIPTGVYRVWYRTSDGENYAIRPADMDRRTVTIPYENKEGKIYNLTVTFSLQSTVNNGLPTETVGNIKRNASQIYYTQNRMVSAQDYNVFPFSKSSNIQKLKAVNKTHAGHSRYIDINDPTGTVQNIELYGDDGYLYKEYSTTSSTTVVSPNNTANNFVVNKLPELLKNQALNNFLYETARKNWVDFKNNSFDLESLDITWRPLPVTNEGATGYMTETTSVTSSGSESVLTNNYLTFKQIQENNFIKWVNPDNVADYKWVRITREENAGLLTSGLSTAVGPWTLSASIPAGWKAHEVIVSLRKELQGTEIISVQSQIENKKTFGLGYSPAYVDTNLSADTWYIIENENLDKTSDYDAVDTGKTTGNPIDSSWLLLFTFVPINESSYKYEITLRGENYILQSNSDIKFYNINNVKVVDTNNKSNMDKISITTLNNKPGSTERFRWYNSNPSFDSLNDSWYSEETGAFTTPTASSYNIGLPLRSRDTKWFDVGFQWESNFGIMRVPTNNTPTDIINLDTFVNDTKITLNTYYDDGTAAALTTNVTIANNIGTVSKIPGNITIPFTNTTFGYNIINSEGNVMYKQYNTGTATVEIFHANSSGVTHSFGVGGASHNASSLGRLILANVDVNTQSGNLVYTELQNQNYLNATDSSGKTFVDKIVVSYENYKDRLDRNIDWHIIGTYKEPDGFTDNSKVLVAPYDTDNDLVPDRPLQFSEFVDSNDLVFFEKYDDFDGYTYERSSKGEILDYRGETVLIREDNNNTLSPDTYDNPQSFTNTSWIVVDNYDMVTSYLQNNTTKLSGVKVYVVNENKVYIMTPNSTNVSQIRPVLTDKYSVKQGRGESQNTLLTEQTPMVFKWNHVADKDVRIDPSISNVIEMTVLTKTYNTEINKYLNVPGTPYPTPPSAYELSVQFSELNEFKSASDSLIFKSAKFKKLFGADADPELQAKFRVVKLSENVSDNEIKSKIISAFNTYFDPSNWDFGETFYFTELSTYVHQQLKGMVGSIVILPKQGNSKFGDLFSVKPESNELFLSTAKVSDIEIISKLTRSTINIDNASNVVIANDAIESAGPYAINGYYPLYADEVLANAAGDGTSHIHRFYGQVFYMPNGLVMNKTMFHGNYTGTIGNDSSSSNSGSTGSSSSGGY